MEQRCDSGSRWEALGETSHPMGGQQQQDGDDQPTSASSSNSDLGSGLVPEGERVGCRQGAKAFTGLRLFGRR